MPPLAWRKRKLDAQAEQQVTTKRKLSTMLEGTMGPPPFLQNVDPNTWEAGSLQVEQPVLGAQECAADESELLEGLLMLQDGADLPPAASCVQPLHTQEQSELAGEGAQDMSAACCEDQPAEQRCLLEAVAYLEADEASTEAPCDLQQDAGSIPPQPHKADLDQPMADLSMDDEMEAEPSVGEAQRGRYGQQLRTLTAQTVAQASLLLKKSSKRGARTRRQLDQMSEGLQQTASTVHAAKASEEAEQAIQEMMQAAGALERLVGRAVSATHAAAQARAEMHAAAVTRQPTGALQASSPPKRQSIIPVRHRKAVTWADVESSGLTEHVLFYSEEPTCNVADSVRHVSPPCMSAIATQLFLE